jgi:hypothetical protein
MNWDVGISPRERKMLIGGALAIGGIIGGTRGLPWWRNQRESAAEEAREAKIQVETARTITRNRSLLRDSAAARARRYVDLGNRVLRGRVTGAAGAELSAAVAAAAEDAGLRLASIQVQPDSVRLGDFVRVSVRADFCGDVRGISNLLRELERGPLILNIRQLGIAQPEPLADDTRPETLRSHVVVEALALSSGGR